MARVASQKQKNHEQLHVRVFYHIIMLPTFVESKKQRALTFCEDLSKFQPVNSDLKPFREFLDDVRTQTTPA